MHDLLGRARQHDRATAQAAHKARALDAEKDRLAIRAAVAERAAIAHLRDAIREARSWQAAWSGSPERAGQWLSARPTAGQITGYVVRAGLPKERRAKVIAELNDIVCSGEPLCDADSDARGRLAALLKEVGEEHVAAARRRAAAAIAVRRNEHPTWAAGAWANALACQQLETEARGGSSQRGTDAPPRRAAQVCSSVGVGEPGCSSVGIDEPVCSCVDGGPCCEVASRGDHGAATAHVLTPGALRALDLALAARADAARPQTRAVGCDRPPAAALGTCAKAAAAEAVRRSMGRARAACQRASVGAALVPHHVHGGLEGSGGQGGGPGGGRGAWRGVGRGGGRGGPAVVTTLLTSLGIVNADGAQESGGAPLGAQHLACGLALVCGAVLLLWLARRAIEAVLRAPWRGAKGACVAPAAVGSLPPSPPDSPVKVWVTEQRPWPTDNGRHLPASVGLAYDAWDAVMNCAINERARGLDEAGMQRWSHEFLSTVGWLLPATLSPTALGKWAATRPDSVDLSAIEALVHVYTHPVLYPLRSDPVTWLTPWCEHAVYALYGHGLPVVTWLNRLRQLHEVFEPFDRRDLHRGPPSPPPSPTTEAEPPTWVRRGTTERICDDRSTHGASGQREGTWQSKFGGWGGVMEQTTLGPHPNARSFTPDDTVAAYAAYERVRACLRSYIWLEGQWGWSSSHEFAKHADLEEAVRWLVDMMLPDPLPAMLGQRPSGRTRASPVMPLKWKALRELAIMAVITMHDERKDCGCASYPVGPPTGAGGDAPPTLSNQLERHPCSAEGLARLTELFFLQMHPWSDSPACRRLFRDLFHKWADVLHRFDRREVETKCAGGPGQTPPPRWHRGNSTTDYPVKCQDGHAAGDEPQPGLPSVWGGRLRSHSAPPSPPASPPGSSGETSPREDGKWEPRPRFFDEDAFAKARAAQQAEVVAGSEWVTQAMLSMIPATARVGLDPLEGYKAGPKGSCPLALMEHAQRVNLERSRAEARACESVGSAEAEAGWLAAEAQQSSGERAREFNGASLRPCVCDGCSADRDIKGKRLLQPLIVEVHCGNPITIHAYVRPDAELRGLVSRMGGGKLLNDEGERLNLDLTPRQLGLENNAKLDLFYDQVGGGDAAPREPLCELEGCDSVCYRRPSGEHHNYCGRWHAALAIAARRTPDPNAPKCALPGCAANAWRPDMLSSPSVYLRCCGRKHAAELCAIEEASERLAAELATPSLPPSPPASPEAWDGDENAGQQSLGLALRHAQANTPLSPMAFDRDYDYEGARDEVLRARLSGEDPNPNPDQEAEEAVEREKEADLAFLCASEGEEEPESHGLRDQLKFAHEELGELRQMPVPTAHLGPPDEQAALGRVSRNGDRFEEHVKLEEIMTMAALARACGSASFSISMDDVVRGVEQLQDCPSAGQLTLPPSPAGSRQASGSTEGGEAAEALVGLSEQEVLCVTAVAEARPARAAAGRASAIIASTADGRANPKRLTDVPNNRESQADDQRAIVAANARLRRASEQQRVKLEEQAVAACDGVSAATSTARLADAAGAVRITVAGEAGAPPQGGTSERRVGALAQAAACATATLATATLRRDSSEESLTDTLAQPVDGVVFYQSERPTSWAAKAAPTAKSAQPQRATGRLKPCNECDGCLTRTCVKADRTPKCPGCLKAIKKQARRWTCEKQKCLNPKWVAFANVVTVVQANTASGTPPWEAATCSWAATLAVITVLVALALLWVAPRVPVIARWWRAVAARYPRASPPPSPADNPDLEDGLPLLMEPDDDPDDDVQLTAEQVMRRRAAAEARAQRAALARAQRVTLAANFESRDQAHEARTHEVMRAGAGSSDAMPSSDQVLRERAAGVPVTPVARGGAAQHSWEHHQGGLACTMGGAQVGARAERRTLQRLTLYPNDIEKREGAAARVYEVLASGYADSTNKGDDIHWRAWEGVCEGMETSPWRTDMAANSGLDPDGHQEEVYLCVAAMVQLYEKMLPRRKSDPAADPRSAAKKIEAVRRRHSVRGITMVDMRTVTLAVKGLCREYIREHGVDGLVPDRKLPFTDVILRAMLRTPNGAARGSLVLDWDAHHWIAICACFSLAAEGGDRNKELRDTKRDALIWKISGKEVPNPTRAQLLTLQEGDGVWRKHRVLKNDAFGSYFAATPTFLAYRADGERCACRALASLELALGRHDRPEMRKTTPLFGPAVGESFTGDQLLAALHLLLVEGAGVAPANLSKYSVHSFRIFLACALLAADCPRWQIKRMLRWRGDESLEIYARINDADWAHWVSKSLASVVDSTVASRLAASTEMDFSPEVEARFNEVAQAMLSMNAATARSHLAPL